MGRHFQALEIYIYKIKDFNQAEDYCKELKEKSIFQKLLELYFDDKNIIDLSKEDLNYRALNFLSDNPDMFNLVKVMFCCYF